MNKDYEVFEDGRVWSNKVNRYLQQDSIVTNSGTYKRVTLSIDGKAKHYSVHRLVAEKFIPNPDNKPQVHHIDHDPSNNHVSNLMWVTASEQWDEHMSKLISAHNKVSKIGNNNTGKRIRVFKEGFSKVYKNCVEASKELNVTRGNLSSVARGELKQTKGYMAEYVEAD